MVRRQIIWHRKIRQRLQAVQAQHRERLLVDQRTARKEPGIFTRLPRSMASKDLRAVKIRVHAGGNAVLKKKFCELKISPTLPHSKPVM